LANIICRQKKINLKTKKIKEPFGFPNLWGESFLQGFISFQGEKNQWPDIDLAKAFQSYSQKTQKGISKKNLL